MRRRFLFFIPIMIAASLTACSAKAASETEKAALPSEVESHALEDRPHGFGYREGWIPDYDRFLTEVFSREAEEEHTVGIGADGNAYTRLSTVEDVIQDPYFADFGRLLFPVDRSISEGMTLEQISSSSIYVWYHDIKPDKTVEIIENLHDRAASGEQVFYDIYTEEEKVKDPSKEDTGLFFFKGKPGEKAAVVNAGGGFMYVGAMHDSFPHALELSKMGYNSFALIYRPEDPYTDLAQAIRFIYDHAKELEVNPEDYSLWGGSAGARMAAVLGNREVLYSFGMTEIPQAAAVIMQYTGYSAVSDQDSPTYVCVGTSDGIANWKTMQTRLQRLENMGIPTEFHAYEGLPHGFGLGTGTSAEGWIQDAVAFWEEQCR